MSIPILLGMCERPTMNAMRCLMRPGSLCKHGLPLLAVAATVVSAIAETATAPTSPNAPVVKPSTRPAAESGLKPAEAAPASAPAARGTEEAAFRIVAQRNIFNANRSGGPARRPSAPRPAHVESFTLVGTMAYEKGAFAFFEGSSSGLSKAVKAGSLIASYKVTEVRANAVMLEGDRGVVELRMGSAMRREGEGPWNLDDGGAATSEPSEVSPRDAGLVVAHGPAAPAEFTSASAKSSGNPAQIPKQFTDRLAKKEKKAYRKASTPDSKTESKILKRFLETAQPEP